MNELTKDELDFLFYKSEKTSGRGRLHGMLKNIFRSAILPKFFFVILFIEWIRHNL